ncbi:MAG: glycosyltransferase family 4 protein [Opitutaceae bacterium]|nr:glycosyltransferase family 4 protein [Opitutaceae bacterium]
MMLVIIQDFLRCGGTEQQSLFLARWLSQNGHQSHVITFRPGGPLARDLQESNIPHTPLQKKDRKIDWYAPGLIRQIKKEQPDLILCMGRMANCYAGRIQRKLPETPVIGSMRTGKKLPWLYRKSLKKVRAIIANSLQAKTRLVEQYDIASEKITVIRNAIVKISDAKLSSDSRESLRKQYGASPQSLVFICAAMFRPQKDHQKLVRLMAKLSLAQDWQLWLIGTGITETETKELVRKLNLEQRVKFLGYQADPSSFYTAADIALLTSRSESLTNFLVEAQWHGLPIVAERNGGVGECFSPDKSGFLIEPGCDEDFLQKLNKLMSDTKLRQLFSEVALQYSRKEFSSHRQCQRHLELFTQLLNKS